MGESISFEELIRLGHMAKDQNQPTSTGSTDSLPESDPEEAPLTDNTDERVLPKHPAARVKTSTTDEPALSGTASPTTAPGIDADANGARGRGDEARRPVVIVDDLHVRYKVYSSGKSVGSAGGRRLLTATRGMREVHAVKGISFTAYENESIGVIGSNGSGKSTLMRSIVGLTPPASGAVYASSRPNMLGVGAALIPELSGDKNITLGGLALGYSRKEVEEMRRDIIEFAELEDFIDLPMRTYSSGMSARLKFAIAASKKHEILIVDEALAVGDARFRQRSEARIREIREDAGTVFMVSHSMKSILDTCNRVLWINKGVLEMDGEAKDVIKAYQESRK